MNIECGLNVERMPTECQLNDIRMLANILADVDAIHQSGHIDPAAAFAIVALVGERMERMATECQANAD